MTSLEKSVTQVNQPTLKFEFERWMDFLAEDLKPAERAARKRWKKQINKLCTRCIVEKCQAPLVDLRGRLRATNVVGKAVCRPCRDNHAAWYRWFRGKYTRTYFVNGNHLLKRRIDFDGVERFKVCSKIYDASGKPPIWLDTLRWAPRGEMLDGSKVPEGVRGPDLVVLLDRPGVSGEGRYKSPVNAYPPEEKLMRAIFTKVRKK